MAARSLLFVPGNRPDRFDKAVASGADAVVIDLEDAVAPRDKDDARAAVDHWLHPSRPVVIRINGSDTPWFRDDCSLLQKPGVAAVMLPKAEQVHDILIVAGPGGRLPVMPLIETAKGFGSLRSIAHAKGVQRLAFGSIDFQLDLGVSGDDRDLQVFRSFLVLESRIAGLAGPIDGVTTSINDMDPVHRDAASARRIGFSGKLCIHPNQVAAVNEAFSANPDELEWAARVVDAASRANGHAVAVAGRMVDKPVILRAQRMLEQSAREGNRT